MRGDRRTVDISVEHIPHLGQLLLQATLITSAQLEAAGGSCEIPPPRLGSKLVLAQAISHTELHEALYVHSLLCEQAIDAVEAAAVLKVMRSKDLDAESALDALDLNVQSDMRMGDLLRDAGILSETQLSDTRTEAVSTCCPLSSMLLMFGLTSEHLLKIAADAQHALRNQAVTREQVLQFLSAASGTAPTSQQPAPAAALNGAGDLVPTSQSKAAQDKPPLQPQRQPARQVPFSEFLLLCGLLKKEDIEKAQNMREGTPFGIDTVVRKMHSTTNVLVGIAGRCYTHVQLGTMGLQEAIDAVDYCKGIIAESSVSIDELAAKLTVEYGIKLM